MSNTNNKNNHTKTVIAAAIAAVIGMSSASAYDIPVVYDDVTQGIGYKPNSNLNLQSLQSDAVVTENLLVNEDVTVFGNMSVVGGTLTAFDGFIGGLKSLDVTTENIRATTAQFGGPSDEFTFTEGTAASIELAPIDNGDGTTTYYTITSTEDSATSSTTTGGMAVDNVGNVNISAVSTDNKVTSFDRASVVVKDASGNVNNEYTTTGVYDADTGVFTEDYERVVSAEVKDLGGGNLEVSGKTTLKGDVNLQGATTSAGLTNTGQLINDGDVQVTGVLTVEGGIDAADLYTDYISVDEIEAGDVYADYVETDEIDAGIVYADALNVRSNATVNGDLTVKGQVHFSANPDAGLTLSNDVNTGASTVSVGVKNAAGETNGVAATSTTTTIRGGTGTTTAVLDDAGFTLTTVEPVTNITTAVTKIDKNGNLILQGSATTVGITNTGDITNTGKLTNNGNAQINGTLGVTGLLTSKGISNTNGLNTDTLAVSGVSTTTGITNTGNIATTTLAVSGASTTTGITNTGNIATTTLTVSGASTTTGITNTGKLTSTGDTTLKSTSGSNSVAVSNAGVSVTATTTNITATTSAVAQGGTTSLTLNNTGASFAGASSSPVVVSGIANGVSANDAVNYGQLTSFRNQVQAQIEDSNTLLSRGIASTVAMSNIPNLDANKTFSIGVGVGHYNDSNAFALGANYRVNESTVIRASVGRAGSGTSAVGAGAAFAW